MSKKKTPTTTPQSTGKNSRTGYIGESQKEIGNIRKGAEVQLRPTTPPKTEGGNKDKK